MMIPYLRFPKRHTPFLSPPTAITLQPLLVTIGSAEAGPEVSQAGRQV